MSEREGNYLDQVTDALGCVLLHVGVWAGQQLQEGSQALAGEDLDLTAEVH